MVFNVAGNKYRIITIIQYQAALVIVQHALTHEEYSRGGWK
ncbi:MAG: type II toxin-antitoxin system HigB family toxin [Acidobacteriaceae bacterium]|nr:type II toxin-antitoxin system HigB family toxin [Acidobacteriaceae bacterium]